MLYYWQYKEMTTGGKSWNEVQPLFLMCSFLSFGEKSVRKLRLFFILLAIPYLSFRCIRPSGTVFRRA